MEARLGDRYTLRPGGPAGECSTGLLVARLRLRWRLRGKRRNRKSGRRNESCRRHRLTPFVPTPVFALLRGTIMTSPRQNGQAKPGVLTQGLYSRVVFGAEWRDARSIVRGLGVL